MGTDRVIPFLPAATVLARVLADVAVHRRQRVVRRHDAPGHLVTPSLLLGKPGLNTLAGWAGMVSWRQEIDIDRPAPAQRTNAALLVEVRRQGSDRSDFASLGLPFPGPCFIAMSLRAKPLDSW